MPDFPEPGIGCTLASPPLALRTCKPDRVVESSNMPDGYYAGSVDRISLPNS
jgi:hypothetical protein